VCAALVHWQLTFSLELFLMYYYISSVCVRGKNPTIFQFVGKTSCDKKKPPFPLAHMRRGAAG
jgi:hypothetical protein